MDTRAFSRPRPRLFRVTISCLTLSALLIALAFVARVAYAHPAASYTSSTAYPVVFVHGLSQNNSGLSCGGTWGTAENYLRGSHAINGQNLTWTGTLRTVGFYYADTACDAYLYEWQSYCTGYFDTPIGNNNESIRHLGCELAWYIYLNWSQYGQNVQAVGHSMGGLIVRYALYGTAHQLGGVFPPYLYMQDAVSLSAPHGGVPPYSAVIACSNCVEGQQMTQGSSFMNEMYNSAQNPQGAGPGTDWTTLGGKAIWELGCDYVSAGEATYMTQGHKTYYTSPCYGHGGYLTDTNDATDGHVHYCNGCPTSPSSWSTSNYAPHALHRLFYSLYLSTW